MTDQNSQFFAILTAVGEAKQANANALGVPWTFAQMGVGDANNTEPVPSRTQTKLINERRRAALNQISVDPKNSNIIIAEQVIPPDEGGWWIREIGLYDATGDLVAVANCAPSFKPLLSQGTGKTQVVRLNLIVTSTANVQLKIDPAVVLATREYVDSSILNVLPKNKVAGTYTKVRINDRGIVQEGANPTTLEEFGIVNALKVGVTSYQRPILSGLGFGSAAESGGAIEIREAQEVGASNKSIAYAPRIMMHWTGVISGDIAMDSQGQLQWKAQRLYHEGNFNPATKADKATTLGGYGITDAMAKGAGGLLTQASVVEGRLSAIPETRFVATSPATEDRPAGVNYAAGVHVTWGGGEQCIDFLGALNGQEDFFVRSCYQGAGTFRKLWTEANFTPALKANLASPTFTGIPRVPNAAAGTATDQVANTKFVTDGLAGKLDVVDAKMTGVPTCSTANVGSTSFQVANTEFVQNTLNARVATQSQVNGGTDDTTIVTPKKIRWGFSASFGTNSYIAFPTWLGGLVIQSGTSPMITDNINISFPIAFPSKCLALVEHDVTGTGGTNRTFWQFRDVTNSGFNALNIGVYNRGSTSWAGTTVISGCTWFAIGY